ncbi:MAG: TM2 domain-containing protein [Clostridia bacterium]
MNRLEIKRCPRCKEKCVLSASVCPECGLKFARLLLCTNAAGKKARKMKQKDKVLMQSDWPFDASRKKALLLCGFLGIFGAHNFYVGRYFKAAFSLIFTCATLVFAALTIYPDWYDTFMSFYAIPGAFPLIFWFVDFARIAIGKYPIPVAIAEKGEEI